MPDCEVIVHEPEQVETFSQDWPDNRLFYCTAQGGEFMNFVDYEGIICLIDADTTIQRGITDSELVGITPKRGQFTACLHAYPAVKLHESRQWLLPTEDFVVNQKYIEISAAMLIAHSEDWKKMRDLYVRHFKVIKNKLRHHAATQWLISFLIQKHFSLKIGPAWLHNAIWYRGTKAEISKGMLVVRNTPVIFNHTKWNANQ